MDWKLIIERALTGGVAALGGLCVAAWLSKKLIVHLLDKDLNSVKLELKHAYDTALAKLEYQHTIKELEYETRFKSLHIRRFELIAELYSQLVNTQMMISNYVKAFVPAGDTPETERRQQAFDAWNALSSFYQTHRLFFTESECVIIDKYIGTMREAQIDFAFRQYSKSEIEIWGKAIETMDNTVVTIREMLEKEFRGNVGVH